VDTAQLEWRTYCSPRNFDSFLAYMVSLFASLHCIISFEVYEMTVMITLMSSIVSTISLLGLLSLEFFHEEGFMRETFLFLDIYVSSGGFWGSFTSPSFYIYSSPFSSSLSTTSSPPPLGDSKEVSSDGLLNSCISSFFFLLLLLGVSYSPWVTTGLPIMLGSDSSTGSIGIRSFACHSFVISSRSSSVSL